MVVKVLRWLDANLEKVLLCIFLAVIAIVMFVSIILRFVFSHSLTWSDEIARYLFVWTGALGVSFATKNNSHIRMDVIPTLIPKISKPLAVLGDIALGTIAVLLINGSIPFLKILARTGQLSGGMQIPMTFVYVSFTIGFSLTLFRLAQKYVLLLLGYIRKSEQKKGEQK